MTAHAAHSAGRNDIGAEKIQAVFDFGASELFTDRERVALRVAGKHDETWLSFASVVGFLCKQQKNGEKYSYKIERSKNG
ncbi:MAG: hypothetical protein V7709_05775 [Halioglobus sp.]